MYNSSPLEWPELPPLLLPLPFFANAGLAVVIDDANSASAIVIVTIDHGLSAGHCPILNDPVSLIRSGALPVTSSIAVPLIA
jgi:hypothetical protein